ncbi:hypothetical protein IT570_05935 [Candidatus Sumerlaeota bacterium]|nr:hypothetical protein [Candidatus Sumerlaeota bacterium]
MLSRLLLSFSLAAAPLVAHSQMATPPALNTALQTATVGSILELGFSSVSNAHLLNPLASRIPDAGGSLLYSDCPETVTSLGKLYEDTLPAGTNRIYLYHVNGMGVGNSVRISAVLTNEGTTTETATVIRRSFPTPSGNYSGIGREGVRQYYENAPISEVKLLAPGESTLLDSALDARVITNNQLVNVTFDVVFTGPLLVDTVAVAAAADTLAEFPTMGYSPNDAFLRQGTFSSNARDRTVPYNYKTTDGIKRIRIAEGTSPIADPPLSGKNAESGGDTTLRGNFAVTYKVRVNVRSDDNRHLALLLNPRGGAYGGYFRVTYPEAGDASVGTLIPAPPIVSVSDTGQGAVISLLAPTSTAETLLLEFTPAGAMNLPFEILLVPYSVPATPTPSHTASPSPTESVTPSPSTNPSLTPTSSPSPTEPATPSPTISLTASPTANSHTSFKFY